MKIKLSICLVTRNRSQNLKRALICLKQQSVQPFEILVSDDSDDELEIANNQKICSEFEAIYHVGPKKGLYANRNFIAKQVCGTHFRTMDDDHTFPEDHIFRCLEAITKHPETIFTIGEYLPNQVVGNAPHPIAGQLHPRGYSFIPKTLNNYYGISCGATVYPASVVKKSILNVEHFKFGIAYLEYGLRLSKLGFVIKPLTETYVIHHNIATHANENSIETLKEARIFAMLALSFKYQRSVGNMLLTSSQIIIEIVSGRLSFQILKRAYKLNAI